MENRINSKYGKNILICDFMSDFCDFCQIRIFLKGQENIKLSGCENLYFYILDSEYIIDNYAKDGGPEVV